jgi:hypothetical protein
MTPAIRTETGPSPAARAATSTTHAAERSAPK